MKLQTLGGLGLEGSDFRRAKPLLLAAYLAVEGPAARDDLARLFWPGGRDPLNSLRVALFQTRKQIEGLLQADEREVWTPLTSDAHDLIAADERGDRDRVIELGARGAFLAGVATPGVSEEIEEWLLLTREMLAGRVRAALVSRAEARLDGAPRSAADDAAAAFDLTGAATPGPEELPRIHAVLHAAGHPLAARVREEAAEWGLELAPPPPPSAATPVPEFGDPETPRPEEPGTDPPPRRVPASAPPSAPFSASPPASERAPRRRPLPRPLLLGALLVALLGVTAAGWRLELRAPLPPPDPEWTVDARLPIDAYGEPAGELPLHWLGEPAEEHLAAVAADPPQLVTARIWPVEVELPTHAPWPAIDAWDAVAVPAGPTEACPDWRGWWTVSSLRWDIENDHGDLALLLVKRSLESAPAHLLPLRGEGREPALDVYFNPSGIPGRGELNDAARLLLVPHPSRGRVTFASGDRPRSARCTIAFDSSRDRAAR